MHLLVGLGNPGNRYERTPHNVGFEMVDSLASPSDWKSQFKALTQKIFWAGDSLLLAKPQTFMNLSGESVQPLKDYYKLPLNQVIVAMDDVSLPIGTFRIRLKGSAGGHNGVADARARLGDGFARFRIGIGGKAHPGWDLSSYVLRKYSKEEEKLFAEQTHTFQDLLECGLKDGWESAMNRFNRKTGNESA